MSKKNKIMALILAIAVLLTMMLSVVVITHEANHDCVGSDCQVCQCIHSVKESLRTIFAGASALAFANALTYVSYTFIYCFAQCLSQSTLVTLKVELLN